jgi:hypothetical protein
MGLPKLVGIIDYYDDSGLLVDWKTGGELETNDIVLQGLCYKTLMEQNNYNVSKILFINLEAGQKLELPRTTSGYLYKLVSSFVDKVRHDKFEKKESGKCNNCYFQLRCELEGSKLWWMI